jgi:uncharacterized phiE125 gp8 family phage protein
MSLDTLANVKTRLGITTSADDSLLALLQDTADAWVAGHCDRDFAGGTFTEYHPGVTAFVFLRNYPVQSVTSVKADAGYGFGASTVVPATAYVVHTDRGVIQSLAGAFLPVPLPAVAPWAYGPRMVQVVYVTATSAVPADVKEAYALLIGHWYRHVKTQVASGFQDVIQQTFGDTTMIFSKDQLAGLPVPDDVRRLLAPYRTPTI